MEFVKMIFSVFVVLAVTGSSLAQRSKSCDMQRLQEDNQKVNVHCDCMQRLTQITLKIAKLTINQTGCSETGLELSWPDLETRVAPESLVLEGAMVYFAPNMSAKTWESSIKNLEFVNCEIMELPANAFQGMDILEEVRIKSTSIGSIKSDAFSGLQQLKVIEVANSSITEIEDHSFNNLPSLEDLAFGYSAIGNIESGAITLMAEQNPVRERCASVGRSMKEPKEVLGGIMGRELTSFNNLSLPEYGTRLTLFKNNIFTINSKAFNTETLGFLIVGGNHILTVESQAFNMELYNECEISAALFVGNTIETLNSLALKGLRGKEGASHQAFLALANNTFNTVFDQAFQLSDNLVVFAVEENQFDCNCDKFGWIWSHSASQIQRELEKEIVEKGVCLNGPNLIAFTSSCEDFDNSNGEVTTETTPEPLPETSTLVPDNHPSSASSFSYTASLAIVVFSRLLL